MSSKITDLELGELCAKYREILRLRREQDGAGDPRPAMRALAARFPGSLRELDSRTISDLEARLSVLEGARRGEWLAPTWAALQLSYHAWLGVALRVKRAAAVARDSAAGSVLEGERGHAEAELPVLSPETLAAILRPAGGRIVPWVLAHVAALHTTTPESVAAAVFAVVPAPVES